MRGLNKRLADQRLSVPPELGVVIEESLPELGGRLGEGVLIEQPQVWARPVRRGALLSGDGVGLVRVHRDARHGLGRLWRPSLWGCATRPLSALGALRRDVVLRALLDAHLQREPAQLLLEPVGLGLRLTQHLLWVRLSATAGAGAGAGARVRARVRVTIR